MKNLLEDLKKNALKNIYLFYGVESYLKKFYTDTIISTLLPEQSEMMNLDVFEGKNFSIQSFFDACETIPFLSDKRIVLLKDSLLCAIGRKDDSEKLAKYLENIPPSTLIILNESDIDKRSKLFKTIDKLGGAIEFKTLNNTELTNWVVREFEKTNMKISENSALHLIKTVCADMNSLSKEISKLSAYKKEPGTINNEDIDVIASKSLEAKIFDLIDAIASKQIEKSLELYQNMMIMKESPLAILSLLSRQFKLMMQCKQLTKSGESQGSMASSLGIPYFVVSQCIKQSANFNISLLYDAFKECLDTDIAIKTGKMQDKLAVEILIIKYAKNS